MRQLTVFTPTYNRAYILPKLKDSLVNQTCCDFEWLIIDDGSTDNTESLILSWQKEKLPFKIIYHKVHNGGKPRAINYACSVVDSEWMFIIDSDDYLINTGVRDILDAIEQVQNNRDFVGVGFLRGHQDLTPFGKVSFENHVDSTNLQRKNFGLDFDCNEAYRVDTFKNYPFKVWPGEIFTPEEVTLNEMSLNGYKLRWFNKVIVISEYLSDGMTKGAWALQKQNPMGYAMLWNHKLKYTERFFEKINYICQFCAMCIVGNNPRYILKTNAPLLTLFVFPIALVLSIRRIIQFYNVVK